MRIKIVIEKKTAYGWSLATTPEPSPNWYDYVPHDGIYEQKIAVVRYLKGQSVVIETADIDPDRRKFKNFLANTFSPDAGAVIFGDEPWFPWLPGTDPFLEETCRPYWAVLSGETNDLGITPIALPRSLPDDACDEVLDRFDDEAFVASHVSLAELIAYDWNAQIQTPDGISTVKAHVDPIRVRHTQAYLAQFGAPDDVRMVFWFVD